MDAEPPVPLYSPASPLPSYSQDPGTDETRLDLSPRAGTRLLPTGIFTKTCGSATVILHDQEPNTPVPSYGKEAWVRGSLLLDRDTSNVCKISAKLQGRVEATTADSGATVVKFLDETRSLWSSASSSSPCPGALDITYHLPATFELGGVVQFLPPSYVARFPGFPALFAQCVYTLTISITRSGRFLAKIKTIFIPLEYKPRTRPPRGICATPCFFSALKSAPEEWLQSSFIMRPRCSSRLSAIHCQAFLPSVQIFGLADSIPFHLQISGELASLQQFILPGDEPEQKSTPAVRVSLTRMVSVAYRDKTTSRTQRIGEGHLCAVPPNVNFDCDCDDPAPCECAHTLDWHGEVQCAPSVTVGGFHVLGLAVKDFITLDLVPPRGKFSPLMAVQHAIPIRLVTEAFVAPT